MEQRDRGLMGCALGIMVFAFVGALFVAVQIIEWIRGVLGW